jgi:hypothetical protein
MLLPGLPTLLLAPTTLERIVTTTVLLHIFCFVLLNRYHTLLWYTSLLRRTQLSVISGAVDTLYILILSRCLRKFVSHPSRTHVHLTN